LRALAVVLAFACACGADSSATVVEVPPQPLPRPPPSTEVALAPQVPVSSPAAPAAFRAGEVWRGTYRCAQGETDLEVRITSVQGDDVEAVFAFSHAPSGAEGAYTMHGTVSNGHAVFAPERWIRRPPGYVTVGMRGRVAGSAFDGRIDNPTCGAFHVRR